MQHKINKNLKGQCKTNRKLKIKIEREYQKQYCIRIKEIRR